MEIQRAELIKRFRETFTCRQDVFAEGFPRTDNPNKYTYITARDASGKDLPLADDVIWEHLQGRRAIGVYPMLPGNKTAWVAMDFDGGDDPVRDAQRQSDQLKKAGFFSFVERSRSGNGAHLWVFFDRPVEAYKALRVMHSLLLPEFKEKRKDQPFDRMFPNQERVNAGKYGNLIALPYQGKSYRDNNSGFVDAEGNKLHPVVFFEGLKINSVELVERLFERLPANKQAERVVAAAAANATAEALPGALKVCHFCNWMRQARERMPQQNQEPELYSLACQFAKLEGGERLLTEYGKLHPYSEERIQQKWNQAIEKNMAETCATIRSKFGDCGKRCDKEIEGVAHPYDLAKVGLHKLQIGEKGTPESHESIAVRVIEKVERVAAHEEDPGIAFGWDELDNLTELRNGTLNILAARPGIGKTAAVVNIACNLDRRDVPSYVLSLEMSKEQFVSRTLCQKAQVDGTLFSKGLIDQDEWQRIYKAAKEPSQIFVDDTSRSLEQLLDSLGELVHKHGKGVAFVDYIQLIRREGRESEKDTLDRGVLGLFSMAKMLDIPIIGVSQFNRTAEQDEREGEEPIDSWLKGSGSLEQVADTIHFLLGHRGEGVVPRVWRIHKERERGVAGIEIEMHLDQARFTFNAVRIKKHRAPKIYKEDDFTF